MGNSHSAKAALWGSSADKEEPVVMSSPVEKPTAEDSATSDAVLSNLQLSPTAHETTVPVEESKEAAADKSSGGFVKSSVGTFDEIHKQCKEVFFVPYTGVRFMANRGLSSHFQVQHNIHLTDDKSFYRFGSTFVGTKQPSPTEAYPVMMGEMNTQGDLQAQMLHVFGSNIKAKCIAQMSGSKFKSIQAGADISFKNSCLSVLAADPDFANRSGMFIAQYIQGVTEGLSVGADVIHQRSGIRHHSMMSVAGRYRTPEWQFGATAGSAGLHMSFYRKANEFVQVGVETETSFKNLESMTTFGYQVDVPKMNFNFRGMISSDWTIGSSLEKRLLPFPISLNMTATYNIQKDKSTVGLGCVLG